MNEAGIKDNVTTYTARHSFATIARNECGVSKDDISMCLTHSSGLDITDRYTERIGRSSTVYSNR